MFTPIGLDTEYESPPLGLGLVLGSMAILALLTLRTPVGDLAPYFLHPNDPRPAQLVTATFLHADLFHLLWNGLYLWVFGRFVEDRLGALRFVGLFLLFGVAGHATYIWRGAGLPAVGSSGAVAGLMGLVLFTAPRIGIRVSVGLLPPFAYAPPAWLLLGLWLLFQIRAVARESADGIAYTAHLGGFLAGVMAAVLLRQSVFKRTGWHLPRERHGGKRHAEKYEQMLREEAVWRTIEEHMRQKSGKPPPPAST